MRGRQWSCMCFVTINCFFQRRITFEHSFWGLQRLLNMNIAQKQLSTRRNHYIKQPMCKRFTRVYENHVVSFAIHTYFKFQKLILKCLAEWKSAIFALEQSVTTPKIMLFCMHFDNIFMPTHFGNAGRVYGIIIPYSHHFTNVFLKTPLAPRKICYNFTMRECENIFLGPDLSNQRI